MAQDLLNVIRPPGWEFVAVRRYVLLVAFLALGSSAQAATLTSFTDQFNPADFTMDHQGADCGLSFTALCDIYGYRHDLTDNGFTPGTDDLLSAVLTITFTDDTDPGGQAEKVRIYLDTTEVSPSGAADGDTNFVYAFPDLVVFTTLASDGKLDVLLDTQAGDFTFRRSDLAVWWEENEVLSAIPEPATLSLLGLGLGAAAVRRRMERR